MLEFLAGATVVALGVLARQWLTRRTERANRRRIQQWADESLGGILAEKTGRPREAILAAIQAPASGQAAELAALVDSVTLTYSDVDHPSLIQVSLHVSFHQGAGSSVTQQHERRRAPRLICAELPRAGSVSVARQWPPKTNFTS